ncbi:hypothetical protein D3C76_1561770 [compost metagenome]
MAALPLIEEAYAVRLAPATRPLAVTLWLTSSLSSPQNNPGSLLINVPMSRVMLIAPWASRMYSVPAPSWAKLKSFTDCCSCRLLLPCPPNMTL